MRACLAVAAALALGACASSSAIHPNMSRMHAEQGGRAVLRVMGEEPTASTLRDEVKRRLRTAKAYDLVDDAGAHARTQIEIYLVNTAVVGRTKRVLLGPLAGPAKLTAQVVVRQDENIVDSFVIQSRSSSGSPLAGTTGQAVTIAADKISERLTS